MAEPLCILSELVGNADRSVRSFLSLRNTVVKVENGGPTVAKTMVLDKYPIVLRVVDGVFYIFLA